MKESRRVRAEVDLDAISHNFTVMHNRLRPGTNICAVVKANCYGHGAIPIARMIEPYPYIWGFACATTEEALEIRRAGITKPILILGYAFPEDYEELVRNEIRACIFEETSAALFAAAGKKVGQQAICHLALDTGMSRLGFADCESSVSTIKRISMMPDLKIEGLFTHFARADEKDKGAAEGQLQRYDVFSHRLEEEGIKIPIHHISNSAAIMGYQKANGDMVRSGITNYGLTPSEDVQDDMRDLQPALRLVSHISYVKTLPKGTPISYGGTYVTTRESVIATIPVGYADGYPRSLSNRGEVLIHGKRVPIVGRVCMDQFMVDVTSLQTVCQGEEVVLLGSQDGEQITAEEIGEISGRFNYELVCDISRRVPRWYLQDGKVVEQVDYF